MKTKRILPLLAAGFVGLSAAPGDKLQDIDLKIVDVSGESKQAVDGYRQEIVPGMLLMIAETREEAEAAAELYGIELIRFGNGLAVFETERDVYEVIETGKQNGWPELSPNNVYRLDDGMEYK